MMCAMRHSRPSTAASNCRTASTSLFANPQVSTGTAENADTFFVAGPLAPDPRY